MKKALLPTFAALGILALVAAFVFVYVTAKNADTETASTSSDSSELASAVASDSNYVDNVGPAAVTVVEFLDFECGACGQFYPYVEALREVYDGDINYVVRYFPLPSHLNSMDAALAAEAAAQQGEFEAMYQRLFETQGDWAGGTPPQTDAFRALAVEIGLDMDAYDAAVADPATQARVEADFDAGVELGVNSTPTFFVNDEYIETSRLENLPEAVDAAVKG
ncbi:thioredoxin domain-containing protein [Salinibacterium sp. NSLL150]|uniref:DsbA family protein n=1 Tax=unclassified Salinibacterium TaxID=2632331 RepID=UPI0018CE4541|nr:MULTISPECIES: thioredoxin domain-containing protein [unclassified Salinibacterium]MBH0098619.1 thioredoxin domain-containing protein [Salinibacterium sp. NSLL35]MBH0101374.1 thioredoxin domain-containing protein [Salinibacterium sp. NSLL150]MBH0104133.1 thioredoxin domain-containing protein [Salinibacterium sp. NSLL16]MBH0106894.1 thioredoxin domain-containing protein [Salinibacterium sp. NSLL17]